MEVVASFSQGRKAPAQCGLFTHKSVPVIFAPPCICTVHVIHNHVICVTRHGKVMCKLSTLNYNTVQTFQIVLTVATETLIPCFGMFVRNNIVVKL